VEGKGFRDRIPEFSSRNAVVVGVSCDSPADNRAFRDKFAFPFDLLSDEDRAMSMRYGAARSADQEHPARISYLIDPAGRIARVYGAVKPAEHPDEVLAALDELG
jgi:peroxiredoxin Q/BCP